MSQRLSALISSTSMDLLEHRANVVEACLRQGIFPIDMKNLPAREITPLEVDQEMVDSADVYLGIYAYRYGTIPEGQVKSYTELEFDRAVEQGIPCLIFLMSAQHQILPGDVETTPGAPAKLNAFKASASSGRICKEFKSAEDLRSQVIDALSQWRRERDKKQTELPPPRFHPPSYIPKAPKPYIAHPYVLLQTAKVIGRQDELDSLTDWITRNQHVPIDTRILCLVAIGGMGKSALAWKWFQEIAPNELPNLAGRIWWSFYESDAHWENFIIRALAYTAAMLEEEVSQIPSPEREERLLRQLDERPFLLVLDGLERLLLAYARMDAAYLPDDDLDRQTANALASGTDLPEDVRDTYLEKHRLRRCANPRSASFLRKLARAGASRVLVSTRLYPAELQTETAQPLPGCHALFLHGLKDADALALWRGFIGGQRSGPSDQLLPLFRAFGNYPLLLRALAGEIAEYKPAPGDFGHWWKDNPNFNPSNLSLRSARTHVLQYALQGLSEPQGRVLHTVAAFRMPATWDMLRALLIGRGKPCPDERALDKALTELEDRGLVGWDKKANRYDLHPIVRSAVWTVLDPATKRNVYRDLNAYFRASPPPPNWQTVKSIDDLATGIELFYSLVGLRRYEEAYELFNGKLEVALLTKLSAGQVAIELLEQLLSITDESLWQRRNKLKGLALFALALACDISGQPSKASEYYELASQIAEHSADYWQLANCLCNLALALWPCGKLHAAERAAHRALKIRESRFSKVYNIQILGILLAIRGETSTSERLLEWTRRRYTSKNDVRSEGAASSQLAQNHLWRG